MNPVIRHRTARFRRWLGRAHSAAGLRLVAWLEQLRLDRRQIRAFIHDPGDTLLPTLALYLKYLQTDVCPGSSAIVMAPTRADAHAVTRGLPRAETFTLRRPDAVRGHSADQCLIVSAHRCGPVRRRGYDNYLMARDALLPCVSMAPANLVIEHGDARRPRRAFRRMYARFHAEPDVFATYDATLPLSLQNSLTARALHAPDALVGAPGGDEHLPPVPAAREDRRHLRYPADRPPDARVMCYIERFRRGPSHSVGYMPDHVASLTCEDSVLYQEERRRERLRYYRLYHRPDPDRPRYVPGHMASRPPYPSRPPARTRWPLPANPQTAPYAHLGAAPYDPAHTAPPYRRRARPKIPRPFVRTSPHLTPPLVGTCLRHVNPHGPAIYPVAKAKIPSPIQRQLPPRTHPPVVATRLQQNGNTRTLTYLHIRRARSRGPSPMCPDRAHAHAPNPHAPQAIIKALITRLPDHAPRQAARPASRCQNVDKPLARPRPAPTRRIRTPRKPLSKR